MDVKNGRKPFKTFFKEILLSENPKKIKIINNMMAIINKGVTQEKEYVSSFEKGKFRQTKSSLESRFSKSEKAK